ncbi:hypothetical protein AB0N19_36395, partial [Streptomyces sp. NPDC051132]
MSVGQRPDGVREFASYLSALLDRLDPRGGWSGVFWRRDPAGMSACLDGREVPPWDVVEALLDDLGAGYGPAVAAAERDRAGALYTAAVHAYDARPGARAVLAGRLDTLLGERRRAAERQAELSRRLSAPVSAERAESLRLDLAWAHDDLRRATARCADLHARLTALDHRPPRSTAAPAASTGTGPGRPLPAPPEAAERGQWPTWTTGDGGGAPGAGGAGVASGAVTGVGDAGAGTASTAPAAGSGPGAAAGAGWGGGGTASGEEIGRAACGESV